MPKAFPASNFTLLNAESQNTLNCAHCGQLIDVTDLPIGTTIECPSCSKSFTIWKNFDHYRLEILLGEGGMGSVYRATDLNLNRVVAIKVLKPELSEDKKFISNFMREVEITASLTHPNIVHVYSFGENEGRYYLVMEYIGHQTLDDLIMERKKLGEAEVLDIGVGVANGLNFALQNGGLIHRDIKPGNILFGPNNIPKVVDFGLAVTPETAELNSEIWGTPYYVSPERLEFHPEDFHSDMYSLGVTLYHCLAGRPPFDASTAELVAAKHLNEAPLPLKTYAPYVSEHSTYTIMKAMARRPDDRFSSYGELVEQLEDAKRRIVNEPAEQLTPQIAVAEEGVDDKRLFLVGAIAVGVIVLIVAGIFVWKFFINSV
ncbi:MAG: serine/threonine-protein kinase [Methylacidiphilales bacterium]|nr:serine/threonine-protein kinase [Candidatus Methylacidiphilales bacterium]